MEKPNLDQYISGANPPNVEQFFKKKCDKSANYEIMRLPGLKMNILAAISMQREK